MTPTLGGSPSPHGHPPAWHRLTQFLINLQNELFKVAPMPRTWTDSQRNRQAKLIYRWQPWLRSTGPNTPTGKARSSQNARRSLTAQEVYTLALSISPNMPVDRRSTD